MKDKWKEVKLGEICVINPPKKESAFLQDTDYVSFLPMEDLPINAQTFTPQQSKLFRDVKKSSYTYFADNDVLIAKVTPCFENGKAGIATNLVNKIGFGSSEINVFRPKDGLISDFLYYSITTSEFRKQGQSHLSGASGLRRLTKTLLRTIQYLSHPFQNNGA